MKIAQLAKFKTNVKLAKKNQIEKEKNVYASRDFLKVKKLVKNVEKIANHVN